MEALSLLTATVDEQIEREFVELPDSDAVAPIVGRGQDVRERLQFLSHIGAGGQGDPHARRLPPRPDHAHRRRLGDPRLRGRAGAHAARAAAQALAAARRGGDAALVLLRRGGLGAAARAPGARGLGGARAGGVPDGYYDRVEPTLLPPGQEATNQLLAVFELEKAVYELRYELNNRPDWVAIPVAGIVRLLDED